MNTALFCRFKVAAAALLLVVSASSSAASLDDVMSNMFNNVLVNGTPAGVYETQTRGVIAGPSLYARSKISNVQLMNLQLPRITSDCSGIDAFAGSFSFISKDALVNFLRNIAANAVPYAFKVALGALCNGCEKHMAALQEAANMVNQFNFNSCKEAKRIVDGSGMKEFLENISASWATNLGGCSDYEECSKQNPEKPAARLNNTFPAYNVEWTGNVAWKALQKADYGGWYGATFSGVNGVLVNEMVMSFTGSWVKRLEDGAPGDPGKTPDWIRLPPTIDSVETFMTGGEVFVYSCNGDVAPDACLNPTIRPIIMRGMRGVVRDMIMGTSNDGILFKLSERDFSTLTGPERVFMEKAPGSVATQLVKLSTNLDSAAFYVDVIQEFIAVQLVYNLLTDMLTGVQIAAAGERKDVDVGRWMTDLAAKRMEVMAAMQVQSARMATVETNFNVANHIRASLANAQARGNAVTSTN